MCDCVRVVVDLVVGVGVAVVVVVGMVVVAAATVIAVVCYVGANAVDVVVVWWIML